MARDPVDMFNCHACSAPLIEARSRSLVCSEGCARGRIFKPLAIPAERKALWCHYLQVPVARPAFANDGTRVPGTFRLGAAGESNHEGELWREVCQVGTAIREVSLWDGFQVALLDKHQYWQASWFVRVETAGWGDQEVCLRCREEWDSADPCCDSLSLRKLSDLDLDGWQRIVRRQEQLGRARFQKC